MSSLTYKAGCWSNETCRFMIRHRKGDVFYVTADLLPRAPEPEPAPSGCTWRVLERR